MWQNCVYFKTPKNYLFTWWDKEEVKKYKSFYEVENSQRCFKNKVMFCLRYPNKISLPGIFYIFIFYILGDFNQNIAARLNLAHKFHSISVYKMGQSRSYKYYTMYMVENSQRCFKKKLCFAWNTQTILVLSGISFPIFCAALIKTLQPG